MALAWKAGWVNSPRGFESRILRHVQDVTGSDATMQERATPALRWSRAFVLAGVAYGLGLVAHLSAGGLVPGPVGLTLLLAVTVAACASLLGRAAGTLRITTLVVGGQAFIHTALTAVSGHAGDPRRLRREARGRGFDPAATDPAGVDPSAVDRRGSLYDVYARAAHAPDGAADGPGVPAWALHLADDLTGPHALMAGLHLVAAALVGLWLASGERALWALVRLSRHVLARTLRRLVAALGAVAPAGPVRHVRLDRTPAPRLQTLLLPTTLSRRGPPALLAA